MKTRIPDLNPEIWASYYSFALHTMSCVHSGAQRGSKVMGAKSYCQHMAFVHC
jgi:hypothetical protein